MVTVSLGQIEERARATGLDAAERFELLMPWINGERLSTGEIRERLFLFLEPAAGVQAMRLDERGRTRTAVPYVNRELFGRGEPKYHGAINAVALEKLRRDLRAALDGAQMVPLPSLRFGLQRHPEVAVAVHGRLRDLAIYEVLRLLTAPSAAVLARCPAPAPGDWRHHCGNWFVAGGRRGRTRQYCSGACRVRQFTKRAADANRGRTRHRVHRKGR